VKRTYYRSAYLTVILDPGETVAVTVLCEIAFEAVGEQVGAFLGQKSVCVTAVTHDFDDGTEIVVW